LSSGKEVIVQFDDYADLGGLSSWIAGGYDLSTLPGVQSGSGVRLKSLDVHALPPATNDNNASNNVLVLSGVQARQSGQLSVSTLLGGNQTFMAPSVTPSWKKVNSISYEQFTRQGYEFGTSTGDNSQLELFRLALVNPDTGAFSSATTLQFKFTLKYALQVELSTSVDVFRGTPAEVGDPIGSASTTDTAVFPRLIGLQDEI
jgi:hypothetical protein